MSRDPLNGRKTHRREARLAMLQGQFWHHVYERGPGGVGRVLVHEEPKHHNDIVYTEKELVLGLLKVEAGWQGIKYHTFGAGDPNWDTLGVPAVNPATDILLVNELATGVSRVAPDIINYLTAAGGSVLPDWVGATCIKVTTTLPFVSPMNGSTYREQGLFGGNATTTRNTGRMLDNFRHERRVKSLSNEIVYFVELFYA